VVYNEQIRTSLAHFIRFDEIPVGTKIPRQMKYLPAGRASYPKGLESLATSL